MPEMDGIELLKRIKSNKIVSDVPVILLTSKADVADRLEGLRRGADAYIAKPFNMDELRIQIDNLIANVRRLRGKFSGAQDQEQRIERLQVTGYNDALMDRITRAVNENLSDRDFNVERLCQIVGISRTQLHRKMKEITGISSGDFVRNIRLDQAAKLIRENKVNISEVAYRVGFANQAHFSTTFKKHFGVTPKEYAEGKGRQ
jgi:AraC-like DNA-binding protein